jgi:uncharacterized protein YndB with AHSA1/START domain
MSSTQHQIEVSRTVDAPPPDVFAFLTAPGNHRRLDTSGMIVGSADHVTLTGVGEVFVMNMTNDFKGPHQVENHVVVFEPDRAIGWAPAEPGKSPAGHVWIWRLEPVGDRRTAVTHVYDWSAFTHRDMIEHLPVVDRDGMRRSVELLAEAIAQA